MVVAMYPGTFDPVTLGHVDIVTRAAALFDKVVVAVYANPPKGKVLFSLKERMDLLKGALAHLPNVGVRSYDGLTVQFAREVGARVIVRGLRSGSDFEYEFEMEFMNKKLASDIEFVYMMASSRYQFVSSSRLKEVASLGGDISDMVPPNVAEALRKKLPLPVKRGNKQGGKEE